MFTPTQIAQIFLECFDHSAVEAFRRYIARHSQVHKWMIAADFSLYDKDRPMDCFAFTILPYDAMPDEIEKDVARAVPKDFKKTKELDKTAVQWFRDGRRFHIVVTVNRDRVPFSHGPGTAPRQVAREHIAMILKEATPQGADGDTTKRFKQLNLKAQAKRFNVNLLGDIWLLAIYFAVMTIVIGRERPCEIVGWFPDRDKMINWCDGIWRD
jgi:hypothetical protein